jgi:ubiquinone/menaquinone biosynthesis C-methylase UbiE
MEVRKQEEKKFHDTLRTNAFGQRWSPDLEASIQENPLWENMKYYAIERQSRQLVLDWFSSNCGGKRVLDYCCGNGDDSFIIAKDGAKEVIGIDLSEISIRNCEEQASGEGLENISKFRVMDAEALEFEDDSFDIATEYGALHHLNLPKAYSELARVLKPGGKCLCTEALGHNPIIRSYRRMTPKLRTEWEVDHILKRGQINLAREYFNKVEILGFFHLLSLAAVPLRNTSSFPYLLSFLEKMDTLILKIPGLKWQAWQVVFCLSEPKAR